MKKYIKNKRVICAIIAAIVMIAAIVVLVIATDSKDKEDKDETTKTIESVKKETEKDSEIQKETKKETTTEETTEEATTEETTTEETIAEEITTEEITTEQTTSGSYNPSVNVGTGIRYEGSNGRIVTIDPGHQQYGNSQHEPVGPGAAETKAKVTGGATGVNSRLPEYQLNLNVALKLRDELISRGYTVIMVRETNEVDISNSERAAIANNANSDVFIRIHADSSSSSSAYGMSALCPTPSNIYCSNIYAASRKLSDSLLNSMQAQTGARNRGVTETDTMSGINWSQVPVAIVEMGFMSNPEEDSLLATDDYQSKLAIGMANGIDGYFN